MKFCKSCQTEKPKSSFGSHKLTKDKLQCSCKNCINRSSARHYVENKEHHANYSKQWKQENKDKVNLSTAMRRKRVRENKPDWANNFFLEEAYLLSKLRTEVTGFEWHVDHIQPLRGKDVCGLHAETNIQVIPAYLNYKKSYYGTTEYSWSDCYQ